VQAAIKQTLRQQAYVTALRQYLNLLAGAALIEGLTLEGADSPLLQ
jgi:peptidyl-prolyl cis-trans isomerase C